MPSLQWVWSAQGTNNVRLAQMLRQLAGCYYKEPDCLLTVRIVQGLVHRGKGTIGLNLFFSARNIMSRPAVTGLLARIIAFADAKACEWYMSHLRRHQAQIGHA